MLIISIITAGFLGILLSSAMINMGNPPKFS